MAYGLKSSSCDPLSDQGTFTLVTLVHKREGFPDPPKKTTFPPEFCNEIGTIYVCTIRNYNSEKKNVVPFQNGGRNNRFLFRIISILAKI